jgi:hypothetical protein
MKFVCDAPGGKTWFRIETDAEALRESELMGHSIEKHFAKAKERAVQSYAPVSKVFIEQDIGLQAHLRREMPWFLTLRNSEGTPLASAMVQPRGRENHSFTPIIVGIKNSDPYIGQSDAIRTLEKYLGLSLERVRCYPYGRRVG